MTYDFREQLDCLGSSQEYSFKATMVGNYLVLQRTGQRYNWVNSSVSWIDFYETEVI